MLNSAVLDTAIGMVFVFLVVSFGVTSGNELISSFLKWRATNLAAGIRQLLGDPRGEKLGKEIYQHALIRGLHRDHGGDDDKKKPSYIPSRLFATALLDIALKPPAGTANRVLNSIGDVKAAIKRNQDELGETTTKALLALAEHADSDTRIALGHMEKLQDNVEHWFNGAMDRCAGWYKRKTQAASVVIGLCIALSLNIDSLRLLRVLGNNPVLRASLIAQAEKRAAAAPPVASSSASATPAPASAAPAPAIDPVEVSIKDYQTAQTALTEVTDLGIPIGWGTEHDLKKPSTHDFTWISWWLYKLGGILLTALAASLGAPFWFDLLQKLLNLRAGNKPAEKPAAAPARSA